ncbi:MAG TPA: type II toxin-antitoxin system HicA family toxin [Chloroflexota bacterium]|nr:type II toxin-antitoxin system HicA family toxin [Chloroflexota bacterium]
MPRPRRLSGDEVVAILGAFGFETAAQRGSHLKLVRVAEQGHRQTLTVPRHRELDTGTLVAIFRQASRFVPEGELRRHFYTD